MLALRAPTFVHNSESLGVSCHDTNKIARRHDGGVPSNNYLIMGGLRFCDRVRSIVLCVDSYY